MYFNYIDLHLCVCVFRGVWYNAFVCVTVCAVVFRVHMNVELEGDMWCLPLALYITF